MIKGKGFLKNYLSGEDDVTILSRKHHSLRGHEEAVGSYGDDYINSYRNCPIRRIRQYDYLINSYNNSRNTIEKEFFDPVDSNFCYLCGLNEPQTLDHFHPSSSTPQFSITRHNLIRCCGKCNSKKSDRLPLSDLNLRHPYLDNIYNNHEILFDVFFNAAIKNIEGDIIFDIETRAKDELSNYFKRQINKAIKELEINLRVSRRVNTYLTTICREWNSYGSTNRERQANFRRFRNREFRRSNYKEFFAYKILAEPGMTTFIDQLIRQP